MIIGKFTKAAEGYTGSIETLTLSIASVRFEPVAKRRNEDAPDFRITASYRDIGAAWLKTTGEDKEYLSVQLDDPTFQKPLSCALFQGKDGGHVLTWTRNDRKRR